MISYRFYIRSSKNLRDVKSKSFNCEKDLNEISRTFDFDSINLPNRHTDLKYSESSSNSKSPLKKFSTNTSSNTSNKPCSNKPVFNDIKSHDNYFSINHIKLSYIDDEEVSQANNLKIESINPDIISDTNIHVAISTEKLNEDIANEIDDDDYDDNVIYEGDSDEINDEFSSQDEDSDKVNENYLD